MLGILLNSKSKEIRPAVAIAVAVAVASYAKSQDTKGEGREVGFDGRLHRGVLAHDSLDALLILDAVLPEQVVGVGLRW